MATIDLSCYTTKNYILLFSIISICVASLDLSRYITYIIGVKSTLAKIQIVHLGIYIKYVKSMSDGFLAMPHKPCCILMITRIIYAWVANSPS